MPAVLVWLIAVPMQQLTERPAVTAVLIDRRIANRDRAVSLHPRRITPRQAYPLLRRYRDGGASAGAADVPRTTACRMWFAIMRSFWCGSAKLTLDRHSRPRAGRASGSQSFAGGRCAVGCGRQGSGYPALSASAPSNLGIATSTLLGIAWGCRAKFSTVSSISGPTRGHAPYTVNCKRANSADYFGCTTISHPLWLSSRPVLKAAEF
jgi:hypothetical protein